MKLKLREHLIISRDGNTYEDGYTDVELSREDINVLVGVCPK